MRTTSAAASVDRMKNGPRRRAQIQREQRAAHRRQQPAEPQADPGRHAVVTPRIVEV